MRPLAVDLYCGLGGWSEGFLSEGYYVIGFDIERRPYPGQLVLQDVLTLHGSQFRHAACIVASPPCQQYSYRGMPWNRMWPDYSRWDDDGGPSANHRVPDIIDNRPFWACFRIQREACEASGRYIPMVVENVCRAQSWVGPARWHFGPYYLFGDVPALMPYGNKLKGTGGTWFHENRAVRGGVRSARDTKRLAEQALRANIPFDLASHIARAFKPVA